MAVWTSRETLRDALGPPAKQQGVLLPASSGASCVSLSDAGWEAAVQTSTRVLEAAGLRPTDRVISTLGVDGDGAVVLSEALRRGASAVASVGPRGRMRLHRAIETLAPNVLVTTPTGAMDLLARFHLEFLVEPEELGIERLLLTGEIASAGSYRQLASEFGAEVIELWCDPAYGVALAHRGADAGSFSVPDPDLIGLASLDGDVLIDPGAVGLAEVVVRPHWAADLLPSDLVLRTGWVTEAGASLTVPSHTVGDLVLVRGRWVSVGALRAALARIDGIDVWSLAIVRDGTLDRASVHVGLGRASLLDNPMWAGRIDDMLSRVTPVHLASSVTSAADFTGGPMVDDHRGHHLGCDRTSLSRAPDPGAH